MEVRGIMGVRGSMWVRGSMGVRLEWRLGKSGG